MFTCRVMAKDKSLRYKPWHVSTQTGGATNIGEKMESARRDKTRSKETFLANGRRNKTKPANEIKLKESGITKDGANRNSSNEWTTLYSNIFLKLP